MRTILQANKSSQYDELDYSTSIVRHIHFKDFLLMSSLEE